jgi:hypothetical protein
MMKLLMTTALLVTATAASAVTMDQPRKEQCSTHYLALAILSASGKKEGEEMPAAAMESAGRSMSVLGVTDFNMLPDTIKTGAKALLDTVIKGGDEAMKSFAQTIMTCDTDQGLASIKL